MIDLFEWKMLKNMKRVLRNQEVMYDIISEILKKEYEMSEELEMLELQVAETLGAEQSAITLLEGISERLTVLAEELAEAGIDNAKVLALRDELEASEIALAEAVAANQLPE